MKQRIFSLCFSFFIILVPVPLKAGNPNGGSLIYPALVDRFYQQNSSTLFWFAANGEALLLRNQLLILMDTAAYYGLIAEKYHLPILKKEVEGGETDSLQRMENDRYFTDAAIAVFKDIFQGYKLKPWVGFDAVSERYMAADEDKILLCLLQVKSAAELNLTAELLEPADSAYLYLKKELVRQQSKNRKDSVQRLRVSMNYYRWIHHFRFDQLIVVNQPAARLYYYEKGKLLLNMKTVLGKPSTPTPRFAAWCDQAILYPYWYVPGSIVFNEYLPLIKNNPSWLDAKNMQVIDGNGRVVNHHRLDWSSFHAGYFPYTIRQSTGCDNALGVIKFNIITPYGVYLHDTNNKTAFFSASRYFSHGCIRLEDPIELGNHLLSHKLDTAFLQSCYREQKPVYQKLVASVPVFVVYMPAQADSKGKIIYYKDIYRVLK